MFEDAGMVMIGDSVSPKSVVKEGSGTLVLNISNTYTEGTQVKEGTVKACGVGSFGSGMINISGGTLDLSGHESTNGIQLNGGQLHPANTQRSINLNYAFDSRSNSTAHVINAGITQVV